MIQDYNINNNKINIWLDELNSDRNKFFNEVKTSSESEKLKEDKIKSLENIQKALLNYKKILSREKQDSDK